MFCTNPQCPGGSVSYECPTEYDSSVHHRCNGCGQEWEEPNPSYIEEQKDQLERDYYDRYR